MKNVLKYIVFFILIAGFCTGMYFLMQDLRWKRTALVVNGLDIRFPDSLDLVKADYVKDWILEDCGAPIGMRLDSVNLLKIEQALAAHEAVRKCEAWTTDDGTLHIDILQRKPAVRFDCGGYGFYADASGYVFPIHPSDTADAPVISGNIPVSAGKGFRGMVPDKAERVWISNAAALCSLTDTSTIKFTKIEALRGGDLVLTAATGEKFILGSPDGAEGKLKKISRYYNQIRKAKGDIYETINVKYKGQIICRAKGM